jgi:hypothetical protein
MEKRGFSACLGGADELGMIDYTPPQGFCVKGAGERHGMS